MSNPQVISFNPGFVRLQMPDGSILSVELTQNHVAICSWDGKKRNKVCISLEALLHLMSGQRSLL